jgi:hypothetical protein
MIKVSKESINLREKLSELDFDKVPFQKMPAGSVLQVVNAKTAVATSSNASTFIDVGVEVELNQIGENSIFYVTAGLRTQMVDGAANTTQFRMLASYADGTNENITGSIMINDWSRWNQEAGSLVDVYRPNKKQGTRINFKIQGRSPHGTSWYLNDTWGYTPVESALVIMEIAQ